MSEKLRFLVPVVVDHAKERGAAMPDQ